MPIEDRVRTVQILVAAVGLAFGLASARGASAEAFVELAIGAAFTDDERVDVAGCTGPACLLGSNFGFDGSFQDSGSFALRGGSWFGGNASFVGLGGGVSYFTADVHRESALPGVDADVYLLPLSFQLLLRVPILADDLYPGGRVQPYVAVGPALTLSILHIETERPSGTQDTGDVAFDVGADVRAGLAVMVSRWLGVFAEYRYTHIPVEFKDSLDSTDARFEADLDTHHVSGGVTFRF